MSLHSPKTITSAKGLGINTTKMIQHVDDRISIGTEIWNEMSELWQEGETTIAESGYTWLTKWEVGKPYIITKFLNTNKEVVGVYCDVCLPVQRKDNVFSFTDLYLDVWMITGQEPLILDENELAEAISAGYVSVDEANLAKETAYDLVVKLKEKANFLDF